jgi:hypothetical protein
VGEDIKNAPHPTPPLNTFSSLMLKPQIRHRYLPSVGPIDLLTDWAAAECDHVSQLDRELRLLLLLLLIQSAAAATAGAGDGRTSFDYWRPNYN